MAYFNRPISGGSPTYVLINGKYYTDNVKKGMVLTDNLSEELDSMTIVICNIGKTLFEPFQDATIRVKTGQLFYFVVNTQVEEIANYDKGLYNYTLNLVSKTKLLERVILPNLKIRRNGNNGTKTIKWYIEKVVLKYIKRRFPSIYLGESIISDLGSYYCPEMEWNHPNAKQVINDLLNTIENNPSVCTMVGNRIEYLSLSKTGSAITNLPATEDNSYEQMGDFTNSLTIDASNMVQEKSETDTGWLTARSSTTAELTTSNCSWEMPNAQIDKIYKVYVNVKFNYRDSSGSTITSNAVVDISNRVIEKSQWEAKYSYNFWLDAFGSTPNDFRESYLYYSQGSNKIEGINQTYGAGNNTLNVIIRNKLKETYDTPSLVGSSADIRGIKYRVTFSNVGSARIEVFKSIQEDSNPTLTASQNQGFIDPVVFTKAQRQIVNRMGNETRKIKAILPLSTIPSLGDYIGEYILSSRTISYFDDFAIFDGTFTKNYTQKVNYYGITNRRKYTKLALESESVIREEYEGIEMQLSTTKRSMNTQEQTLANWMASFYNTSKGMDRMLITTYKEDNTEIKSFFLQAYTYGGDRQTTITAQCDDNYGVGMKIADNSLASRHWQTIVPYVDSNGEFAKYRFDLLSNYAYSIYDIEAGHLKYPEYDSSVMSVSSIYTKTRECFKNTAEIFKKTIQFNFISTSDNVIVGDGIGYANRLISRDKIFVVRFFKSKIDKNFPMFPTGTNRTLSFEFFDFTLENGNGVKINVNADALAEYGIPNPLDDSSYVSYAVVETKTQSIVYAVNKKTGIDFTAPVYFNVKEES